MTRDPLLSQRGLTLTEVTVVGVLATIVMLGLVGFYMGSQATWMSASAQAITQREATTLIESIASKVHVAAHAQTNATQLDLYDKDLQHIYVFWWETSPDSSGAADSLVHEGPSKTQDRGAAITSICERFRCSAGGGMVNIDLLLRSAEGDRIEIKTSIAMMNRPAT